MVRGPSLREHHEENKKGSRIAHIQEANRDSGRALFGLWRSTEERALSGVAGGIAKRLSVDAVLVRLAFVVLTLGGGFGALAYVVLWAVLPEGDESQSMRRTPAPPVNQLLALTCFVLGALLILRDVGLWFGDAIVWPLALSGLGAGTIFIRGGGNERWNRMAGRFGDRPIDLITGRLSPARIGAGALLILAGMILVLNASNVVSAATSFIVPVVVTLAGVTLIFGPWLWNLAQQLADERRERIRTEERADLAAHLHDSVLQTLALIQRTDSPQKVAALARVQERELRSWLYGRSGSGSDSLRSAAEGLAERIEAMHEAKVEVVVVGDAPMDEGTEAVIAACGEALANAAKHSGAASVSLYIEVEPAQISAYVRDQGAGFDVESVPPDRRGIADSIVGRLARNGGSATVRTSPSGGTEVQMILPRAER
jgi:signal transduction histidine kinase/phage shock protein PspC (stress-responsive transcriptional regulator)